MSITPVADADGRDRNVDWFYRSLDAPLDAGRAVARPPTPTPTGYRRALADGRRRAGTVAGVESRQLRRRPRQRRRQRRPRRPGRRRLAVTVGCALPYWGKYVYHDNNRDINL